ncbi:MAG: MFS transporter [Bacteroidetes bacterium]|nr:MFS transporter [Bacteroidota bacterium]
MSKPRLRFIDIWNMSFGFLGIQFGFALQGGFMSRIFQTLGATPDQIPGLWLAAPFTGLIVQPIIGYMSDRTWHPVFGRRKPYFLVGAILSTIVLFFVPYSPVLWVASGCLWMLDASINISMEPFRALVADKLPDAQRSNGFVVQTLIIGIGTFVASQLPKILTNIGVSNQAAAGVVPMNVKIAFVIGAVVFILTILYTVFTTKEYPPEDLEAFQQEKENSKGFMNGTMEIMRGFGRMNSTMKKLGVIQFFSWFAFFTMWSMATPALTEHVFHAPKPVETEYNMAIKADADNYKKADAAFNNAADSVGASAGLYGISSMAFALLLTFYTTKKRINRKFIHMASLILGGIGFLAMYYARSEMDLNICYSLVGIAWGSILSMPYAMLSSSIDPKKMGFYMGLFNMFIVIPQIVASIGGINFLYKNLLGDQIINTMILAGISLVVAGLCNFLITERRAITYTPE